MKKEHAIVKQVYQSKEDMQAANQFILTYMPFIKSETAKFLNRSPIEGQDDELSIAMIAFHEAIRGYVKTRGSFLNYASLVIKNRLIDYWRSNQKHQHNLSIETPTGSGTEEGTISDTLTDGVDPNDTRVIRKATREEIQELSEQLEDFGVTLTDVAENSPKQERTMTACRTAVDYSKNSREIMNEFLRKKKLPLSKIVKATGVEKKTLERHRKYLVALLLIYSNGYEIIRGHLSQMVRGENM